jgi:transposase
MNSNKKFKCFIGIDVSKSTLDLCLSQNHHTLFFQIKNSKKEWKSLFSKLKKEHSLCINETLFCLEDTGNYTNPSLNFLAEFGANIWLEMPIKIKRSSGVNRLKTDKTDAKMIAEYAERFQDKYKAWFRPRKELTLLKAMFKHREKLISNLNQYQSPMKDSEFQVSEEVQKMQKKSFNKIIKVLKLELKEVESKIKELIKDDKRLSALYKIITSVPGVGFVTAIDILVNTNEFLNIKEAKKYACYAGVAPFEQSSGTALFKSKVSHFANKNAKKALHMGAMSVVTCSGELKEYYYRKLNQGKSKMSALNAVRNKIVGRVFSCVKRNEQYNINYKTNLK